MKLKFILFTLLTTWTFTSCGPSEQNKTEQQTTQTTVISDFTKSFEGTINGKFEIIMTLTKNSENLSGTYTYKNKGVPIKISGTIDGNGNLTINEFNTNGNMTGIFRGQLSNNNIIGNWTKPDGSNTMPFSISESINSETSIVKPESTKSDDYSNWSGTYLDEFGRSLKIIGPASDGAVKFELTPQNNENCAEDVWSGTAYLTKSYLANYQDENSECHLNFTFNPGQIEVGDYNCSHGASCGTFDGVYIKKK